MSPCPLNQDLKTKEWYEKEFLKLDPEILVLKLARPALRAMINASIYSLNDLSEKTTTELLQLHGMGPSAVKRLKSLQGK